MTQLSLRDFTALHRDDIVRRCTPAVVTTPVPPADSGAHDRTPPVPDLIDALRLGLPPRPAAAPTAVLDGRAFLRQGFTVPQIIRGYRAVCQGIRDLSVELSAPISPDDIGLLDRCLDEAIAGVIKAYRLEPYRAARGGAAARASDNLGGLAQEARTWADTAMFAFDALQAGSVGLTGSTAAIVHRSLFGLRAILGEPLAEAPVDRRVQKRKRFPVAALIDDVAPAVPVEARRKGVTLTVVPVEDGAMIEADRPVLTAVVANLLQNAFKFTRPRTTVTLRVVVSAVRVRIEVQDECGGLPSENITALSLPSGAPSTEDTGVGLGLAFCRWGVEANDGRIYARSLPGKGCVFTVDLPKLPVPGATPPSPSPSDQLRRRDDLVRDRCA